MTDDYTTSPRRVVQLLHEAGISVSEVDGDLGDTIPDPLYTPLINDSKRPVFPWGEYPANPDNPAVYTYDEMVEDDHTRFGIVGDRDQTTTVLDVDLYKFEESEIRNLLDDHILRDLLDVAPLVLSQNAGLHIYLRYVGDDDLRDVVEGIEHVELKGPTAKGHTVSPHAYDYTLIQDGVLVDCDEDDLLSFPVLADADRRDDTDYDPTEFEPDKSPVELADLETTSNFQDILDAISHTGYGDFHLKSEQTEGGTRPEGRKSFDPCWTNSDSGTRLGHDDGHFIYRDGDILLDALQIVAHEEGILPPGAEGERPEGSDFWEAVEALRDRGAHIPVYEPDLETWAESPNIRRKARRTLGPQIDIIRQGFRAETQRAVDEAVSGLVAAPTAIGKTEFAIDTAADRNVTILTSTADKYAEIIARAQEKGITVLQLPSFPRHSSLMNGPWGETAAELYYERGLQPRTIYKLAPDEMITEDDQYLDLLDRDFSQVDLLVGHATHAFIPSVVEDRITFFDDVDPFTAFTDVFKTEDVRHEVETLLDTIGSRYDSIEDVIANGEFVRIKREILNWLRPASTMDELFEQRLEDNVKLVDIVRRTSDITATILDKLRLLCDGGGRYDTEEYLTACTRGGRWEDTWWLTAVPHLEDARQVLVMGAYPPVDEVERFLEDAGTEVEDVFGTDRYADWYRAKNVVVAKLSDWQHSYAGSTQKVDRTEVLADALEPDVIFGHKKLVSQLDVDVPSRNHAALHGLNEYGELESALIAGTAHYGDEYVAIRAQYCGDDPEVRRDGRGPSEWTTNIADRIHERMLAHPVHEAATRVGRFTSDPTVVYTDTRCIPDWFDVVDATDCVRRVTKGERELLDALDDGPATVRDITDEVDVTRQTLYNAINGLLERGVVKKVDDGPYAAAVWDATAQPVKSGYMMLSKPEFYRSVADPGTDPDWLGRNDTQVTAEPATPSDQTVQQTLPPP